MSLPEKSFPVSWDQFHRDARALAWRIAEPQRQWRGIVCITRGGLVPAAIVARELNIRLIETVCVASYHDYSSQGDMIGAIQVLTESVKPECINKIKGRHRCLVSDKTRNGPERRAASHHRRYHLSGLVPCPFHVRPGSDPHRLR